MAAKATLVLCAQILLIQSIYSQAIPCANNIGTAIAAEDYAYGPGRLELAAPLAGYPSVANYGNSFIPANGGGFAVQSVSPIAPTGITVYSENAIEGALAVNGELPFLSAVAVDGALPSSGAGGINYGCGNGAVGIVSEGISPAIASAGPYPAGLGYSAGQGGRGFGLGGCSGIH